MKLGIDTCSLVALGLSGLIDKAVHNFDLVVTPRIQAELKEMSGWEDQAAKAAGKALTYLETEVPILPVSPQNTGEAELSQLWQRGQIHLLITDDMKAAAKLTRGGVEVRVTAFLFQALIEKKVIDSQAAQAGLERIRFYRKWDPASNRLYLLSRLLLD